MEFLTWLELTPVGLAMSGESGSVWLFPIVETLHVLALAVVFGSIAMVDLRLLGLATRDSAVSKLSADILPYTWIAFVCAVITGTLMFVSKAHTYFYNWAFDYKMLCIALAGVNMLVINLSAYRKIGQWDALALPPVSARIGGALSIMLWTGVVFFGRWIGFST